VKLCSDLGFQFDEDIDISSYDGENVDKIGKPLKKSSKAKFDPTKAKKKLSVKEEVDEEEEDLFDEDPSGI